MIFRLVFAGDVEGAAGEGVDVLEACVFALPVGEVSSGDAIVEGLNLRPDDDELVGLGVWHGGEEGGVVHGEDGGVCADAEGQGEKNCEGEAGVLPQRCARSSGDYEGDSTSDDLTDPAQDSL